MSENLKESHPVSRKEDIVVQEVQGETLIYDLKANRAVCLNETSALVWQECDGKKSISEIGEAVGRKLNSPVNNDFVWLALDQLKKEKLISNGDEIAQNFNGLSRREVIKKVGLGSMIALPLVSSLIAPMAANAASAGVCTASGCSCTGPRAADGSCTSTTCNSGVTNCICRGTNGGGNQGTCRTT